MGAAGRPGFERDLAVASLDLARGFAAGATLWCCAPQWPSHALHIAVEFVHPVIVGKRALPAVAVNDADLVDTLRNLVRPGDLVVAVATKDEASVTAAMRRGPAWGVRTLWIGAGDRPPGGAADHVLFFSEDPVVAAHRGSFVLGYHLLWELTHVCFEHPGLLRPSQDRSCEGPVCVTCADEGRLAEVVAASTCETAKVRTAAGIETVDTALVGATLPGDLVLVHAGSAMTLLERDGR